MLFRCTQRLLAGVKFPVAADPPPPAAALAEWYVNQVPVRFAGRSLVLYTNPATLVSVVVPGRTLHTTLPVFRQRLPALLQRFGLSDEWIGTSLTGLDETVVARTINRRVLGTMNEFAFHIQFAADDHRTFESMDLDALESELADTPLRMLEYRHPVSAVRQLAGIEQPRAIWTPRPPSAEPLNRLSGIAFRVCPAIGDSTLNRLFAAAWPDYRPREFANVLRRSLAWVGAYDGETLIGFVNVAWDGGLHAFLLDTTVHSGHQRRGIGTELVRRAIAAAREGGAEWLHVDYEPRLQDFYRRCGFGPTRAGLIHLGDRRG